MIGTLRSDFNRKHTARSLTHFVPKNISLNASTFAGRVVREVGSWGLASVGGRCVVCGLSRRVGGTAQVRGRLFGGFSMGHKLHGRSNANILMKLAGVNGMMKCRHVPNEKLGPVPNGLFCHKCSLRSLTRDVVGRGHFNFRRITCLLLSNRLPSGRRLTSFYRLVGSGAPLRRGAGVGVVRLRKGGVVGVLTHDILRVCHFSPRTSSASHSGLVHRDVSLVSGFPAVVTCTCGVLHRTACNHSLRVHRPHRGLSVTRGFLCVLGGSCARLSTHALSLLLMLRTRRKNNGGSAFAIHMISSDHASACSTVTTNVNSLGNPLRKKTGVRITSVFRRLRRGVGS